MESGAVGLLLARLPLGVGVPRNLGGAPRSAVGVVDSVVSMGRALTPRPRFLVRGSSSTWPTGMVGCANRTGVPLLKAAGVGLNCAGCSALADEDEAAAAAGRPKD